MRKFWRSSVVLLGSLFSLCGLGERIFPSAVSKITKATALFEGPSPTTKSLGEAPEGTPILLRGFSPKKTWALIEDEDGVQAWVPANRVEVPLARPENDLSEGLPPVIQNSESVDAGSKLGSAEIVQESAPALFQPSQTYDLAFHLRYPNFSDTPREALVGALVSYSRYRAFRAPASDVFSRTEFSLGYFQSLTRSDYRWLPIRLSAQTTRVSSRFLMGPDVSLSLFSYSGENHTYFGLGYFAAYKWNQFSLAKLRVSYDLGADSHFAIEGGLQWMYF